jgi:hypothetical protein
MLRYYDSRLDINVMSVDDDAGWLDKTKNYCGRMGVSIDKFRDFQLWHRLDFELLPEFDLIFMDMGTTKRRPQYYPDVLKHLCTPKTLILFDDMHKPILKHTLEHELKQYDYINIPVRELTLDQFHRYCKLIFRLRPKGE